MLTLYDTDEVFSMFQLGSKPFPKIRKGTQSKRIITIEEREKLVEFRCQQVAAGIEIEAMGPSWQQIVDSL